MIAASICSNYLCFGAVLSTFIFALVWIFFYLYFHTAKYWMSRKIPRPIGLPLLSAIPYIINVDTDEAFLRGFCLVMCGIHRHKIGGLQIGHRLFVGINSPELVETIMSSKEFIEKSVDYRFLHPWLGQGLLTSTGSKWFQRRKMLTPAFHFQILEDFMDVFNEQSRVMVQNLAKEIGKPEFDIVPYATLCTLDIICETAMGTTINAQAHSDSDYVKAISRISELIQHRQARPWIHPDWIYALTSSGREHRKCLKTLHGLSGRVVQDRIREYKTKETVGADDKNNEDDIYISGRKKRRLAFLDLLIEAAQNDSQFTEKDICEEVDTFMFEGHDTTAMALCWCLLLLGCHQEYQDKAYEELEEIFGESDRPATSADLTKMKYLEMCLKEALRLYPSVPAIGRSIKQDTKIGDTVIPSGTTLAILPYLLHRDANVFPNPEHFQPDNFLPDRVQRRHPYAYIPFSAGPRNCIGQRFALMEEKVLLSTFLRNYRIKALDRREDIIQLGDLILRPKNGLRMQISRRTKSSN